MNWKSPSMIAIYVFAGIMIISFSLMGVVSVFGIIGSISLTLIFLICLFNSWINYLIYKRKIADQKLSDAYVYAEEFGDEEQIKNFAYDKKTQRKLRREKFSHALVPLSFLTLAIFGVSLVIICFKII